ncbi:cytochrome c biogenesis protein DipZ [Stenotrophomonas indicatrix]|uniref:cytochrome c biogenesis protein DipZ n=1 Tax=Stenotrophomonas TaxID=40323 RepID=UPI0003EA76E5|nr:MULTISPECIES: cytochrome c biogenesis protein DipZ [Stenotrophomonas]EVT71066.1 cytochrome C biogenesis protein [Stenotrophomonas maltophilia 5BA-I-2]QGL62208.1 cytochrome c biogenesis protein DipZ [Stenotrophomonas maltophilia]EZP45353.1 Cytochrome c biogenesis protein transmembrane region [Stenotrophomonas sp. RIT309]MBA0100226.1 cytochrome c biogenesis protein DipZ [Stenotrophomonas indicatrix]MDH6333180.1 cytochrome c biogenesis protein CcdA/thiol-disulfide isomerase/thioredoxin [Stenot
MLLLLLAYLGGVLTLLSPCILPVLPFVFARADRPFLRSTLPLLLGMALTFTVVASLAAVGSQWVAQANQVGRWVALVLMAVFAIALLWPTLADHLLAPFQRIGARLSARADAADAAGRGGAWTSLLIGIATGLLWAPCAGPILGLVLTGAALNGASVGTSSLLLAYALGAVTALALAVWVGGRVFRALQARLGLGNVVRRVLGVAALLAVVAIGLGWDTGLLTRLSAVSTARIEQGLLDAVPGTQPAAPPMMMMAAGQAGAPLPVEGTLPTLDGATGWLNSPPLSREQLHGKVVLIDFWTYSCINCLRAMPFVHEWAQRYRDHGLVVIGVHTPEFAFERDPRNVMKAVQQLKVEYPVALDNQYAIWRAFNNRYWPAHYFVDAQGNIRGHQFGEGNYAHSEQVIRRLLVEAGQTELPPPADPAAADLQGVATQADMGNLRSPETYLGHARAEQFASPGGQRADAAFGYTLPSTLALNQWGLSGQWRVNDEAAQLQQAGGRIAFQFHARDLHLVLAPGEDGKPVRFRVLLDGKPLPAADAGADVAADGTGTVNEHRLYQLIRQRGTIGPHRFEIEFLDAGVQAYAFTFG